MDLVTSNEVDCSLLGVSGWLTVFQPSYSTIPDIYRHPTAREVVYLTWKRGRGTGTTVSARGDQTGRQPRVFHRVHLLQVLHLQWSHVKYEVILFSSFMNANRDHNKKRVKYI